jgi:hypothetical protein
MELSAVFGDDTNIFAETMLERGFYPENLPPVFAIENFHEAAIPFLQSQEYTLNKPTECCIYNASKRGGARRNFEMPNPLFMIDASIYFSKFRDPVYEHYQTSHDSLSVPNFHDEGRPVRLSNFSSVHRARRKKLATSRFIIRTDISRYFHSIYTHSVPWALHGKEVAKKDRKVSSDAVFGNRLDQIFRQAKDGQTVGIPVGPDYSRYASEIIGKAIDSKFRERIGDQCTFIRHVDDIFIGANDHDSGKSFFGRYSRSSSVFST